MNRAGRPVTGRHRAATGRIAADAGATTGFRRCVGRHRRAAVVLLVLLVAGVSLSSWQISGDDDVAGPPKGWQQVFAEEFEAPALDPAVWQTNRYGSGDGDAPFNPPLEGAWFDPDNASVDDGSLVLTIQEEPRTFDDRRYAYSSGVVQTAPEVAFQPDTYVEARIRIPRCGGCWPAFWLHPIDGWPPEIDILEYLSGRESRPSFNYIDPSGARTGPDMYGETDADYRDEFHTYGVLWEGDRIVPYLDGRPYGQLTVTEAVPDQPMVIILNLSVLSGLSPEAGSEMLIDWVRVWSPSS